jgi:two-component system chemotaxis response regulator CheY
MDVKALIVDDNFYNRDLAKIALVNAGYRVVEAQDGKEALEILSNHKFALLILELAMPEMDGVALLSHVKSRPEHQHMAVVVVTAYSHMADCVQADTDFVIHKPIDINKFVQLLGQLKQAHHVSASK